MDQKGKQFLDSHLKELQERIQNYVDRVEKCRKNLLEGYMLSSNNFEKVLPKDLKKWDYSEFD